MHGPPPHRRAPRSTLLTAGTARACPGKGKETAHSFHAVTAGGDAFSRRPPRTTDLPGQATIAPGLDALRWAGQCQELGGAVSCGTTRPRSRRTSRGTARCNGTPWQDRARSPWRHAASSLGAARDGACRGPRATAALTLCLASSISQLCRSRRSSVGPCSCSEVWDSHCSSSSSWCWNCPRPSRAASSWCC